MTTKQIQKQPRKARNPSTAGQRLVTSGLSDLHEAGLESLGFFNTMLNPEDFPPQRIPDDHSAMSAVFKTPFVVDLPYSGVWDPALGSTTPLPVPAVNGYSEVILCPGTASCYFYTLGEAATYWAAPNNTEMLVPILATHPTAQDILPVSGEMQIMHGIRGHSTVADDVACLPKQDITGRYLYELECTPVNVVIGAAVTFKFGFNNVSFATQSASNFTHHVVWASGATTSVTVPMAFSWGDDGSTETMYNFTHTLPANNDVAVSFGISHDDTSLGSDWRFSMKSSVVNGFACGLASGSACAFSVVDAPEMAELSETLSERTTALTGLLTFMGSSFADGGQIAGGRLGMGLSPLRTANGDVYRHLASLPFYNDDFPVREGIYAWWLPDSSQELFYTPYRKPRSADLEENAVLHYAVLRDNPEQAVRLKVVQNLEVITRSRLYASMTGAINPAFSTVLGLVKTIPAVTINKKHIGILQRALAGVKGWLSKPTNWKKMIKFGAGVMGSLMPGSRAARVGRDFAGLLG